MDDRVLKDIEPPPARPLSERELFPQGLDGPPDWRKLRDFLAKEGRLSCAHFLYLTHRVTSVLSGEPNLLKLRDPITVVGDIHGQYYDLLKLLDLSGDPTPFDNLNLNLADSSTNLASNSAATSSTNSTAFASYTGDPSSSASSPASSASAAVPVRYLFLGDYVDRGSFSTEVVALLFALKLNFPKSIFLLRGNHECRQMSCFFNFRDECEFKYNLEIYNAVNVAFDAMPLAALINNRFLALHGGLSPALLRKEAIATIHRFQEPPRAGLFCDLLWSDPAPCLSGINVDTEHDSKENKNENGNEAKNEAENEDAKERRNATADERGSGMEADGNAGADGERSHSSDSSVPVSAAASASSEGVTVSQVVVDTGTSTVSHTASAGTLDRGGIGGTSASEGLLNDQDVFANSQLTYFPNDVRGCSFFFTHKAAKTFLEANKLISIIRAHEAQLEGYKMHRGRDASKFPSVITIFSAPNYCDCYNNKGAILKLSANTLNIQQYNFAPHPYHLPNFMDVFTWSLAFIAHKTAEIFDAILQPNAADFAAANSNEEEDLDLEDYPDELRIFLSDQNTFIKKQSHKDTHPLAHSHSHSTHTHTQRSKAGKVSDGEDSMSEECEEDRLSDGGSEAQDTAASASADSPDRHAAIEAAPSPKEQSLGLGLELELSTLSATSRERSDQGHMSRERAENLRNKVVAVGRLVRVLRTLREQHVLVDRLKTLAPGHKIPPGSLLSGHDALNDTLKRFLAAKHHDAINERRPSEEDLLACSPTHSPTHSPTQSDTHSHSPSAVHESLARAPSLTERSGTALQEGTSKQRNS